MKTVLSLAVAGAALLFALPASAQTAGDAAKGRTLFNQRCLTCHTVVAGQNKPTGPNLHAIIGRKAGAATGYRYSKAMAASTVVWDAAKLDAFLAAPLKTMPGTSMVMAQTNAKDRADLIAYLKNPGS
jgi:cytochrome c